MKLWTLWVGVEPGGIWELDGRLAGNGVMSTLYFRLPFLWRESTHSHGRGLVVFGVRSLSGGDCAVLGFLTSEPCIT